MNKKPSNLTRFFWKCAGVREEVLLQEGYESEHIKFFSIGACVFLTALLAFCSGLYTFNFVFHSALTIPMAMLWAIVIFNLDRYIVSNISKTNKSFWSEVLQASPRFLIAGVLAFVIGHPIELKIFEKEIQSQIEQNVDKYKTKYADSSSYTISIKKIEKELIDNTTFKEIAVRQDEFDELNKKLIREIQGDVRESTIKGQGPAARAIQSRLLTVEEEIKKLKKDYSEFEKNKRNQIEELKNQRTLDINREVVNLQQGGILGKNIALSQLTDKYESVWWTSWFIRLVFLILELSPILVKLLSHKGAYDFFLEAEYLNHEKPLIEAKKGLDEDDWFYKQRRMLSEVKAQADLNEVSKVETIKANELIIEALIDSISNLKTQLQQKGLTDTGEITELLNGVLKEMIRDIWSGVGEKKNKASYFDIFSNFSRRDREREYRDSKKNTGEHDINEILNELNDLRTKFTDLNGSSNKKSV